MGSSIEDHTSVTAWFLDLRLQPTENPNTLKMQMLKFLLPLLLVASCSGFSFSAFLHRDAAVEQPMEEKAEDIEEEFDDEEDVEEVDDEEEDEEEDVQEEALEEESEAEDYDEYDEDYDY